MTEVYVGHSRDSVADREHAVAIESAFVDTDETRIRDLFVDFSALDLDSGTDLPVYDLLWAQIVAPRTEFDGLIDCIFLFERLRSTIDDVNADVIVANDDLNASHYAVLEDVATATNTRLDGHRQSSPNRLLDLSRVYLRMVLLMLDQILNFVLSLFRLRNERVAVVFIPQAGREDSMTPVLSKTEFEYSVRVYPLFHRFRPEYDGKHGLQEHPTTSMNSKVGLRTIGAEIRFAAAFAWDLVRGSEMESGLTDYIESTYGCRMPVSVRSCCQTIYKRKLADMLSVPSGASLIDRTDCDAVVVGSPTVPCRGILYAAEAKGVDSYLIPHGIERPREPLVPSFVTMFTTGEFGKSYLEQMFPAERHPRLIPTGRPYLCSQYRNRRGKYEPPSDEEPLRLVVATQNFSNSVRESFVRQILTGTEYYDGPVEVTIKTHPSESTILYRSVIEDTDIGSESSVQIAQSDLEKYVRTAHLLLTVNSNVGVESIVLGTPSASINLWKPQIPTYPYVECGPFPELKSKEEVVEFFDLLDSGMLNALSNDQQTFVQDNYELGSDAATEMAGVIGQSL